MRDYGNECLHKKHSFKEWVPDVFFLIVIAGVIAAVVYLGFII